MYNILEHRNNNNNIHINIYIYFVIIIIIMYEKVKEIQTINSIRIYRV